jgi:tRNA threonylcarbamoyladenosine biosynthesis protein TsaB
MLILGLDSALGPCSAAVWRDGQVIAEVAEETAKAEAVLLPMVAAVMGQAGIAYDALDRIAVTLGPGSFTGLRVGIAAARGLSLAARRPAVGITTFEALAAGLDPADVQGRDILVAIEAGRGDVYAQAFAPDLTPRTGPACLAPAAALDLISAAGSAVVAGNGGDLLRAALAAPELVFLAARPVTAGVVAGRGALRQDAETAAPPEPLYLRNPAFRRVTGGP